MANGDHSEQWDDLELREVESITYRQVEGAVAYVAVFATFAAVVMLFWT
jgi:hypothetical protein